jgi:Integrase core domain
MRDHLRQELAIAALTMAIQRQRPSNDPGRELIHHSDRGSQYPTGDYRAVLKANGILPSMSRKGNCWDNAPMESWFHTLKTETPPPHPLLHSRRGAPRPVRLHRNLLQPSAAPLRPRLPHTRTGRASSRITKRPHFPGENHWIKQLKTVAGAGSPTVRSQRAPAQAESARSCGLFFIMCASIRRRTLSSTLLPSAT